MNKTFDNEYYRNRYREKREQILNNHRIWRKKNAGKKKESNRNYYLKKKNENLID